MNDSDRKILIRYWCGYYDDVKIERKKPAPKSCPIQSLKNSPMLDKIDKLLTFRNNSRIL